MKRIIGFMFVALIAASGLSAQAWNRAGVDTAVRPIESAESITVEGKLALVNGMIAIESGDTTYYVGGLNRLIGFVDGLEEGSRVKVEGYAFELPAAPEYVQLRAESLEFNGRSFDLSAAMGRSMGKQGMSQGMSQGARGGSTSGRGPRR